MDEAFDTYMESCGIIDFGIPYRGSDGKKCERDECYECFDFRGKQTRERIKFQALSDRNKQFYLNRYAIFKTKWDKVVKQCHETSSGDIQYALPEDLSGYSGNDGLFNTEFAEIYEPTTDAEVVSPFKCRKAFVANVYDEIKRQIEQMKHCIRHLKELE